MNITNKPYIEGIKRIILELDRFRYDVMMVNIDRLEKRMKSFGLSDYWLKWKNKMNKIVKKRLNNPLLRKYALIRYFLRLLAITSIIIVNLIFLMFIFNMKIIFAHIALNPLVAIILILIIPNLSLCMEQIIGRFIKDKVKFDPNADRMLHEMINGVIRILLREIRRGKMDKAHLKMKLLFGDYKNIEIIREVGIFRKHYLVILKV